MDKLEALKHSIESGIFSCNNPIIFKCSDNDFIPVQYINYIVKNYDKEIRYVESLDELSNNFFMGIDDSLKIFRCNELNEFNKEKESNLIIITYKIDKAIESTFEDLIITVPKLEDWQIKDYLYSILPEVNQQNLNDLILSCKGDIYRIDNEASKLLIFNQSERSQLFDKFINDGVFSDLSKYTVFDFTNAIIKKDIDKLYQIYRERASIDLEPMGILTILINSIRDIIKIQFDPKSTPESLGLSKSKYWAIRYSCGVYSNKKLISIFDMLCSLDKKVKLGEMPTEILIDYILTDIFS